MALENPALNERSFLRGIEEADGESRGMTAAGTYAITGLLLVLVVAAAAFGWSQVEIVSVDGRQEALTPAWTWLVFLLTFIVALVGAFAYRAAPITSVLYALGARPTSVQRIGENRVPAVMSSKRVEANRDKG